MNDVLPALTPDQIAAYEFVTSMMRRADGNVGTAPWWYGWALREAYLAGINAERERQRTNPSVTSPQ